MTEGRFAAAKVNQGEGGLSTAKANKVEGIRNCETQ